MKDFRTNPSPRDTKWADGLRGIAAIFVVTSHLTRGYCEYLLQPTADSEDWSIPWYNYPFIRVYAEGFPWVGVFLVLMGFVNALKPIKQARAGRTDVALTDLARSSFRRTSRLVLPCTVATVFSWAIAQIGGYKLGSLVESDWMNSTSPLPSGSVLQALEDLVGAIYSTWARADNIFDRNQWTMAWFLKGSMCLFVALLATVHAVPHYRMLIFLFLFIYSWISGDAMVGMTIFSGTLLAELSMEPSIINFASKRSLLTRAIPFSMVLLGWYLMSYPGRNTERATWSDTLLQIGVHIFPANSEIYSFWLVTGVLFVVGGIVLSATLQNWLSHRVLLWLGANSFPIYLLHGPLLRSVLNWMLLAFTTPTWYNEQDEDGNLLRVYPRLPIPPRWKFAIAIPVWFVLLLLMSHWWTLKIEPWCAAATKWLEDTICGRKEVESPATLSAVSLKESGDTKDMILPS